MKLSSLALKAGFAVCLFYSPLSFSFEGPLRDPTQLNMPMDQKTVRVSTARVLHADYDLIRRDFPELKNLTNAQIDTKLIDQVGAISINQTRQTTVNEKIQTLEGEAKAFRPRGYGRALVFPFEGGLVDAKGAGALSPSHANHQDGLASTQEAWREFMMEKTVKRVLDNAGYKPGTVESYAVIDYGFDIIRSDGKRDPAGLVLRQAAQRGSAQGTVPPKQANEMEAILRKYGIVSDNEAFKYDYQTIDRSNIQMTKSGALFDYGSYQVLPENAVLKGSTVQPDPALRVPGGFWGLKDHPNGLVFDHDAAKDVMTDYIRKFQKNEVSRDQIADFANKKISTVSTKLGGSCSVIPALEALAK